MFPLKFDKLLIKFDIMSCFITVVCIEADAWCDSRPYPDSPLTRSFPTGGKPKLSFIMFGILDYYISKTSTGH